MNLRILTLLALALTAYSAYASIPNAAAAPAETRTYGLHLFFDEKEYVDVLTFLDAPIGIPHSGHMSVPNDFEGDIENLLDFGGGFSFDLLVPANGSRPEPMYFTYKGTYFDESKKQMIGYVVNRDTQAFIASFVAFLRE